VLAIRFFGGRLPMKSLLHFKRHEDKYFHAHPFNLSFSLIAGFVLAVLIVFVLAVPAR
jgi:hypothetical protein